MFTILWGFNESLWGLDECSWEFGAWCRFLAWTGSVSRSGGDARITETTQS